MNVFSIKNAILVMFVIGLAAAFYVLGSSIFVPKQGPLQRYAFGAMSKFRTYSDAPGQPNMPLKLETGDQIYLSDKHGKLILVNFWASWCGPCVAEMPSLDALQAELGSDEFEVVAISMDMNANDAKDFYASHAIKHLRFYYDPSFNSAFTVGALGLPLTILYDPYGEEIGRLSGDADWASSEALALINAAIARY